MASTDLFTGVLGIEEVNRLLSKAQGHGIRELLYLGFNSGMDLGEILVLPVSQFRGGKQEIILKDRTVIIPSDVAAMLDSYSKKRIIRGLTTLWDFQELAYTASLYQQETFELIKKPISWKAVRRTYIFHATSAGMPLELVKQNTGVDYKYLLPYVNNGKDYKALVNGTKIYEDKTRKKKG